MYFKEYFSSVIPSLVNIVPEGWLKEYIDRDLETGFIGNLDLLAKDLIINDDIFGKNRRGIKTAIPDLGIPDVESDSEPQYAWWNGETQSNWLDGFFRTSVMLRNEKMIKKASDYLADKLSTQDEDGYIGIYQKELRYMEGSENGELWTKAALCRALFAYYEYTQDKNILDKIKKALDLTMQMYPIDASRPFSAEQEKEGTCCSGLSHGLTITDVYLELYRYTQEQKYLDYCIFLYESYSKEKKLESDMTISNLSQDKVQFRCHGVHTYEHIRALTIYSYATGNMQYLEKCFETLPKYLNPSGAPAGDESVYPKGADPTRTGYEYCSIHELLHSYCLLLQTTGDRKWADKIEWLFFNAGRGSHHPRESAIAYLKSDNSYAMQSEFQIPQPHVICEKQTRYKYSPVHQDVAVCCVPNAGRIVPYYLQNMWHCHTQGFTKMLYGPSILENEYNNSKVSIEEISAYPDGNIVTIKVNVSKPVTFALKLRIPSWWKKVTVQGVAYEEKEGFFIIHRQWSGETKIQIAYQLEIVKHNWSDKEYFYSYGANVLALPIASNQKIRKRYAIKNLHDTEYIPDKQDIKTLMRSTDHSFEKLVPMGTTILRKVTWSESRK